MMKMPVAFTHLLDVLITIIYKKNLFDSRTICDNSCDVLIIS